MPSDIIQWFPGHMAKTRRLIGECLGEVDIILEILDARIPVSSKNPEIDRLVLDKPVLTLLNKATLADPVLTDKWLAAYAKQKRRVLAIDCITGNGLKKIKPTVEDILWEKLERYKQKGIFKPLRAMVVGIPNVGKSSLINRLCGEKKAAVENRPGVTVRKQWVKTSDGLELLDMPGVLWPKFEDRFVGENLALTGAIKDAVLQNEEMACVLCARLCEAAPAAFAERFSLTEDALKLEPYDLFLHIGKKKGWVMSGGVVDERRCASMLLDAYRTGKIGRITLEKPE